MVLVCLLILLCDCQRIKILRVKTLASYHTKNSKIIDEMMMNGIDRID